MKSNQGFLASTVDRITSWATSQSLWYYVAQSGCCADEALEALGCRYDLERFGCLQQTDPAKADLLIVNGAVTKKSANEIRSLYEAMPEPRYVMAVGACASCGGPFACDEVDFSVSGVDQIIPVDVYVPGCPPRPEAILNGLIKLQDKVSGKARSS